MEMTPDVVIQPLDTSNTYTVAGSTDKDKVRRMSAVCSAVVSHNIYI